MRILYSAGGGVGNVVMATPAISALAEMGHEVSVKLQRDVPEGVEGLLRGWDAVRSVNRFEPTREEMSATDYVVHNWWSRHAVGHAREISPPPSIDLRATHEVEANMLPVRFLGYRGETPTPHVEVSRQEIAKHERIVFAPGCKPDDFWKRKKWKGWWALAELIPRPIIALGTTHERMECANLSIVNMCGETSLREAAEIMANCSAVVAIDNGLAHVAAALGVPTVVMFGATSEVKNRPLGPRVEVLTREFECRPCQMTPAWERCRDWQCMDFDPAEVAAAVREMLA